MKKNTFESPSIETETIDILSERLLKATTQLAAANKELLSLQKEREEMLSNISHDLRAPLTAIHGALDYMDSLEVKTENDYQTALAIIRRRTLNLESLVNDMYYLFCVEDTTKELSFEKEDVCLFLETYFYDAIIDARYDTHDVYLEIAPELEGCLINVDRQRLIRVLDNLMTNAAKYSEPEASITLEAKKCQDQVVISVIDTGFGIPEDALNRIFHRTFRVSSARTPDNTTGSGLGLSIVKAIVERHGGNIRCESTLGKGSTFIITLPLYQEA